MRNPLDGSTCTLFSREDMGAMLNLKLETVSREISKLAHEGIIEAADKASRIYFIRKPELLLDR
jgi:DNA-binding transcriptional regulator YhcF (GntR family)